MTDMPDVETPQATWRDDPEAQRWTEHEELRIAAGYADAMAAAVAARDRELAAMLRAEIKALPLSAPGHTATVGMKRYRAGVLAVLDAVLGGDS